MSVTSVDKIALVTGAGSGIGQASAYGLLQNGFDVIFAGRRQEPLELAVKAAPDCRKKALSRVCDVTDEKSVFRLFDWIESELGRLDVLFNNAGASLPPTTIDETSVGDWKRVVDVNLTGAFLCARAAFALMRKQSPQGGRIINNGSISAERPRPGSIAYTATKHAISGMTKSIALDGRSFNIACGQIDIGNAASDMAKPLSIGALQANGDIIPEPMIDLSHVSNAVIHMASLPLSANIQQMTILATKMPFVGRG